MMCSSVFLRQIRKMYGVPVYHGMRVKTRTGELGIIDGADGFTLRIYMGYQKPFVYITPDKIIILKT